MASQKKFVCNCVQCDGNSTCCVSDTDSASEEVVPASQSTVKEMSLETGELQAIPEVSILHVEPGKVAREVEVIRVELPKKREREVEVIKFIPGKVSSKTQRKRKGVDVSETENKKARVNGGQCSASADKPIDLTIHAHASMSLR